MNRESESDMNALIVSTCKYPNGDAGAVRIDALAQLFEMEGITVTVVGLGPSTKFAIKTNKETKYCSFRSDRNDIIHRILNRLLFNKRLKQTILNGTTKYDYILYYDGGNTVAKTIKSYCKKHSLVSIYDCVEWYSPEQFKFGKFSYFYREKENLNKTIIDRSYRVISISGYLENYFANKGIKTIRIPVILKMSDYLCNKMLLEDKVVYIYAGTPGKKDYLSKIISGFSGLSKEELFNCKLHIFGVTEKQLEENVRSKEKLDSIRSIITCFGSVPRSEVIKQYSYANFSVFMRDANQRYSKAGFPTKFVESLALGTPVICNLTSDIGEYLVDGYNGFICRDFTSSAFTEALRKSIIISRNQRNKMCENARITAETHFDISVYKDIFRGFII